MAELNKHVTQMIVVTPVLQDNGEEIILPSILCTQAHNDFFFHTANQTPDSLHNDHSADVPHFIIALILKPQCGWTATDGMCTCNQLSKGYHGMQSLLKKSTDLHISTTHMRMALCMYTCSCMPTTLSPWSPLARF